MAKRHQKRIMERKFNYEIKQRFFEPPNFSMCSDGEEVVIARVANKEMAVSFIEAVMVDIINSMFELNLVNLVDLNDHDLSIRIEGNQYILGYQEYTAQIFTVEPICPACGCNPQDEPYCMEATHCPQCGYAFEV